MEIEKNEDGMYNATRMCQSAGKFVNHFAENLDTKSFLNRLLSSTSLCMDRIWLYDAIQQKTWVHPKVAERLERWLEKPKKTGRDGMVYIITSNVLDAVKIGCCRGSMHNLYKRYKTCYGEDLQVRKKYVADCREAEVVLHEKFAHHCITGELFAKSHLQEYIKALQAIDM